MRWPALTLNQKLATVALVLGAGALFSQPHRGPVVKLDTRELAMIVEKEVDHVKPAELAAWIVEGRTDYRLLDLRSEAEFAAYHVPTAENVPVSALPDFPLLPQEKVVLYSEGGIHAAQAWFLLRAQGHTAVYTVLGGLDGWKDEVLFPVMPADASPQELARFERTAAVARFFGGTPRTASDAAAVTDGGQQMPALATPAAPELPRLAPAAPGRASPVSAPTKKKKEGC
jgi:rhodanese-related sulfurtransferase